LKQDTDNPNTGFLPLLAKAADHLANNASIKLISLNYKESKLDIELVIDNFQKLDELKSNIEKQGIKAEIISATADDKSVLGRLRLSGKV
jgi:type II secretory pathway component PulL